MERLIAQDLSKRYYHNELTYRDLENLEKQFRIKFDNLVSKIDSVEKNLKQDMSNLAQDLKKDIQINGKLLLKKLKISSRIIILITVLVVPIAISSMANIVMSIIGSYLK
ncbi:Bdr family repetitive protein [Borreliella bavariensis]|uniref:Bdr family repetitive protein n=1 Tax=Borreliella bavariensis TaxID=664662 RepID=UPI001F3B36FA|nr:Bdr family repetitive protein [Borreliella bavariensis]